MVLFCLKRGGVHLIPGYMTIKEASEKWGVSIRYVNLLCNNGKVPNAQKLGTIWAIPWKNLRRTEEKNPENIRIGGSSTEKIKKVNKYQLAK